LILEQSTPFNTLSGDVRIFYLAQAEGSYAKLGWGRGGREGISLLYADKRQFPAIMLNQCGLQLQVRL